MTLRTPQDCRLLEATNISLRYATEQLLTTEEVSVRSAYHLCGDRDKYSIVDPCAGLIGLQQENLHHCRIAERCQSAALAKEGAVALNRSKSCGWKYF